MNKLIMAFTLVFLFFSCTKKDLDPAITLKEFVEKTYSKNSTRKDYDSFLTGKIGAAVKSMTDEDFKKYFTKEVELKKFKVLLKNCSDDKKCFITYLVVFEGKGPSSLNEVKRIAELSLEDSGWKISDITNLKSYYDFKNPLEIKEIE